jgi:ABC-type lipoprotein release transport system permease subunit
MSSRRLFEIATRILMAVAMLAAFIPAWKAAHIDPITALRYD